MREAEDRVRELLRVLNDMGEHERIEAKTASEVGKSVLETVCAFANEPELGGGALLLGVARAGLVDPFEPGGYVVVGVRDPEKLAEDLASQCASVFSRPLRPRITPVRLDGDTVLHVQVSEAAPGEKPVFFRSKGLPGGAYRRIGATDQRCTDDDVQLLYDGRRRSTYDADVLPDARLGDLDPDALEEYRALRREVAPEAEELSYGDEDLLLALNAVREVDGELRPTVAGLLLFGTGMALRRFFGMMRVDYIRVPGREWVSDPDERYSTIPIRAPLIRAVRRAEAALVDDLPRAFHLPEGSLQRKDLLPLPRKVLREALVNAVMHRDYRVHGAVQVIRYANRIEIRNPGYSLRPQERLGQPGSDARNPVIAAVLHDTNLAEMKGTGIRAMRRLMQQAELVPPTFESDRQGNAFTARLVLHHFLGEEDLAWLDGLGMPGLTAEEKLALVFVREVGAVDNPTYRDLTGVETLKASAGLRRLCDAGLLEKRGQSTATHYVGTKRLLMPSGRVEAVPPAAGAAGPGSGLPPAGRESGVVDAGESSMAGTEPSMVAGKSSMAETEPSMVGGKSRMAEGEPSMAEAGVAEAGGDGRGALYATLPEELQVLVDGIGPRADPALLRRALRMLCSHHAYRAEELGLLVRRYPDYLKTRFLKPMLHAGELEHTIPDMPKHPSQAYRVPEAVR